MPAKSASNMKPVSTVSQRGKFFPSSKMHCERQIRDMSSEGKAKNLSVVMLKVDAVLWEVLALISSVRAVLCH